MHARMPFCLCTVVFYCSCCLLTIVHSSPDTQSHYLTPAITSPVLPACSLKASLLPSHACRCRACFAPWWQWQQRRVAQREAQLRAEYKSMAPLKLEEEGIRQEQAVDSATGSSIASDSSNNGGAGSSGSRAGGSGMYVLQCPACRADVLPSSLAHAWPQLQVGGCASG
jgi:hypothetical protein